MSALRRLAAAAMLAALAGGAEAQSCSAVVTDIDFGSVSVRSGVINQTSGNVQVSCGGAAVSAVGVCLRFGAGSGGAGSGNSPRYMRRADGATLSYELRPTGNGASYGTLNDIFLLVPIIAGSGSAQVPIYADITSSGVAIGTGRYSSVFSGVSDIEMSYGIASCDLLGATAAVPDFAVAAEIVASCEIDAGSLAFGQIPSEIHSPVDRETTIAVRCTDRTPYSVTLGLGTGPGVADPAMRRMSAGGNTLAYGLYRDASRIHAWGEAPGQALHAEGAGLDQVYRVYGRLHPGQSAVAGIYTDSVLVTVNY